MELIPILSTIVLAAIAMTIVLAVGSYVVYRLRDIRTQRRESEAKREEKGGPKYLERYRPGGSSGSEK